MSITVKTQSELDKIPIDCNETIYIEFGTCFKPAIVKNKYRYSVVARGNSSVEAWENSSVEAWENSSVVARENSSVEAWGNSSVEAWENSSVEANANVQVVDRLDGGKICISGNARKVYMPKTIKEFMDFYGIRHDKENATFYKAVHKLTDIYVSDRNRNFVYAIGSKVKEPDCEQNIYEPCGKGIHISHLGWAIDYGRNWDNLAILELKVKIDDIVLPINTDGKVRVPEADVIREVPLEECGIYGKILAKRRKK